MLTTADDHFHETSGDPFWNESSWFSLTVPERGITGWVYFFHRPNMNYTVGGIALWDRSGDYEWDCLYYDWGDTVPLAAGGDAYDFTTLNGLTVACRTELRAYELGYKGDGCEADLVFEGFLEPQEAGRGSATGMPKGTADQGKGHYDQPGRMRGTITLDGERIGVDCFSMRDHSWGPRRYSTNPRGDYTWAIADERSAWTMFATADLPEASDPCVGVADPMSFGWYLRDGQASRLVEGHRTVTERDERGRPVHIEVRGIDEMGRELRADGVRQNALFWHGYANMHCFWCGTRWSFDGHTDAVGENQDHFPFQHGRRYLRALAANNP